MVYRIHNGNSDAEGFQPTTNDRRSDTSDACNQKTAGHSKEISAVLMIRDAGFASQSDAGFGSQTVQCEALGFALPGVVVLQE